MTPEQLVIAAARYAHPLQCDLREAGRRFRILGDCFAVLDGRVDGLQDPRVCDETRGFARAMEMGQLRPRIPDPTRPGMFVVEMPVRVTDGEHGLPRYEFPRRDGAPGQTSLF